LSNGRKIPHHVNAPVEEHMHVWKKSSCSLLQIAAGSITPATVQQGSGLSTLIKDPRVNAREASSL